MSVSDFDLVRRFHEGRDERAFAELVRRHGGMVYGVCLRILDDHHEAEDAFQATFFALSAKVGSLKPRGALGGWLHRVAVRTAQRSRKLMLKKQHQGAALLEEVPAMETGLSQDLELILDEELSQLPDRYRVPIILCHLEGHTSNEAANIMSVPRGTIASWLKRGRALLRKRLVKRGVAVSLGTLGAALTHCTRVPPALSSELIQKTAHSATLFAAGSDSALAALSPVALSLAKRFLQQLSLTATATKVTVALVCCTLALLPISTAVTYIDTLFRDDVDTPFRDDFADGSISDGTPATWITVDGGVPPIVEADQLVISSRNMAFACPEGVIVENPTIQARFRITQQSGNVDFVALYARAPDEGLSVSYNGSIGTSGLMHLSRSKSDGTTLVSLGTLMTNLTPANRDVIMRFEIGGSTLRLMAWHADEDISQAHRIELRDATIAVPGSVGLALDPNINGGSHLAEVRFDYFEVVRR